MGPLPLPQIIQGRNFACSVLPFLAWIESFKVFTSLKSLNVPDINFKSMGGSCEKGISQFKLYIVVVGRGITGLSKTQLCNFAILQNTLGTNLSHFATSWMHLLTKVTDFVGKDLHLTSSSLLLCFPLFLLSAYLNHTSSMHSKEKSSLCRLWFVCKDNLDLAICPLTPANKEAPTVPLNLLSTPL